MSDYLAKRCAECVSFYRDQIAQAKVQTPYGDGLPAPWAFLDEACRVIESLQSQLAAANERADAAVKALKDARGQVPAAYETRWAGKGGPYAWGSGFLHKIYPDAVADGTEIRALYAAPVPAQPAVVPEGLRARYVEICEAEIPCLVTTLILLCDVWAAYTGESAILSATEVKK